jgi:hypothetical protein
LQIAIDVLKEAISKGTSLSSLPPTHPINLHPESWETKGKFPPAIKPLLAEVAVKAIVLQEYDEHFFNLMPVLFPYNKFTMSVSGVFFPCCCGTVVDAHTETH